MKTITVVHYPDEDDLNEHTSEQAHLVTPLYAMYYSKRDRQFWLDHVKSTDNPDVYETINGIVLTEKRASAIAIYRELREMSGFDFVVKYLLPPGIDIEMRGVT